MSTRNKEPGLAGAARTPRTPRQGRLPWLPAPIRRPLERPLRSGRWAPFALAAAGACVPQREQARGHYPLYPNPHVRPPSEDLAYLTGTCVGGECNPPPIKYVDGKDVSSYGSAFDLLPGCHIVMLSTTFVVSNSQFIFSASSTPVVLPIRMKAGHTYSIGRHLVTNGPGSPEGHIVTTARDEDLHGSSERIEPAHSPEEIVACKEWSSSATP